MRTLVTLPIARSLRKIERTSTNWTDNQRKQNEIYSMFLKAHNKTHIHEVQYVDNFTYLGLVITSDGGNEENKITHYKCP